MKRRGFTLVELLIATIIGGLVMTMAISLYVLTLRRESTDVGLFQLESEVALVVDVMRADFRETNLGSVKLDEDGVSFASANPLGELSNMQVSRFGAPQWQKQVYYTLLPTVATPGLSQLMRYEAAGGAIPAPWQGAFPSDGKNNRVITSAMLSKGYHFENNAEGRLRLTSDQKSPGGLSVHFVDKDNSLESNLPTPDKATRLLQVDLILALLSSEDKLESAAFSFRVYPRN